MKNSRETAFQVLFKVLEEGEYSHIVLSRMLAAEAEAQKRDRAFVTRLTEGTLEHLMTLDHVLNRVSKTEVKKMKPVIRTILRMSVYQLMYMDAVPDSAVCNEAVKLAKAKGFQGLSGFVNGVLRSVVRMDGAWKEDSFYPDKTTKPISYLSVRYSMPEWLCEYFIAEYGIETTEQILRGSQRNPETTIRCNRNRCKESELIERLEQQGCRLERGKYAEGAWYLTEFDSLEKLSEFKQGMFQIQDESSMLVAELAGLKKGDLVVDVCAAPGGKALHAANLLEELGGGTVIARDISEKKKALIDENIARMQADNLIVQVYDATQTDADLVGKADVVIADLPCSGIGIMAKKPEIRYRMTKENQKELAKLQKQILSAVHRYVKPGGILMYSTCTINREENEENAREVCEKYGFVPELEKELLPEGLRGEREFLQILPGVHTCDGFFIARLRKIENGREN